MTLQDILGQIEIQSEYEVVYYDEELNERKKVNIDIAYNLPIQYIYSENNILYIEVEFK